MPRASREVREAQVKEVRRAEDVAIDWNIVTLKCTAYTPVLMSGIMCLCHNSKLAELEVYGRLSHVASPARTGPAARVVVVFS